MRDVSGARKKNMRDVSGARKRHEIDCLVMSTHRTITYARVARYLARFFNEMSDVLNKKISPIYIVDRENQL
ncbi:MAG: hypothetical protein WBP88_10300 [Nitrososphaeraceae archaeon]